jgi:hypothetical protein
MITKKISATIRYGTASPAKPVIHQFLGLTKGVRQAIKKRTETSILVLMSKVLTARRKKVLAMVKISENRADDYERWGFQILFCTSCAKESRRSHRKLFAGFSGRSELQLLFAGTLQEIFLFFGEKIISFPG